MSPALDRIAVLMVFDQGLGRPGLTWSASSVSALSMSACCAPDGPAETPRSSAQSLPSLILRTGSRLVRRSTSQLIGQPT